MEAFKAMSTNELWHLHEEVASTLARKLAEEKAKIEDRLRFLKSSSSAIGPSRSRRAYPKVLPKYQNPKNPAEKWSGRGKQPRWLQAQLRVGNKLNSFLITSSERRHRTG
jgi:DNA-binding protein H-NS